MQTASFNSLNENEEEVSDSTSPHLYLVPESPQIIENESNEGGSLRPGEEVQN